MSRTYPGLQNFWICAFRHFLPFHGTKCQCSRRTTHASLYFRRLHLHYSSVIDVNHTHDATNFSLFVLLIPEYQTQPMTTLVIDVLPWTSHVNGVFQFPINLTHDIQIECINRIDNAAWIPTMLSSLASAYIQHFIGGHSTRKHALPYFVKWLSSQPYIYTTTAPIV